MNRKSSYRRASGTCRFSLVDETNSALRASIKPLHIIKPLHMILHSLPRLLRLLPVGAAFLALNASAAPAPDKPPRPPVRVPKTDQGVTQLSDEQMKWLLDAKFGMFIHWGLYSGPGKGGWMMHNQGISPEKYRKYASPESGNDYFDAKDFHPEQWAAL